MGWTIVTNDLIWWIPFGLMLWGAYQRYVERQRAIAPEVVRFALRTRTSDGTTLDCLSRKSPVLLVFLRHLGCTFCRQALDDLARQRARIEGMGTSIVLVHMEAERDAVKYLKRQRLADLPHITDPCQHLYRAFGLKRGTIAELFGPKAVLRGLQLLPKYGVGRMLGDAWQMPGAFLLYEGEVIRSYRHQSVADRPAYTAIVTGAEPLAPSMHI
jgi:peroxiredoxin